MMRLYFFFSLPFFVFYVGVLLFHWGGAPVETSAVRLSALHASQQMNHNRRLSSMSSNTNTASRSSDSLSLNGVNFTSSSAHRSATQVQAMAVRAMRSISDHVYHEKNVNADAALKLLAETMSSDGNIISDLTACTTGIARFVSTDPECPAGYGVLAGSVCYAPCPSGYSPHSNVGQCISNQPLCPVFFSMTPSGTCNRGGDAWTWCDNGGCLHNYATNDPYSYNFRKHFSDLGDVRVTVCTCWIDARVQQPEFSIITRTNQPSVCKRGILDASSGKCIAACDGTEIPYGPTCVANSDRIRGCAQRAFESRLTEVLRSLNNPCPVQLSNLGTTVQCIINNPYRVAIVVNNNLLYIRNDVTKENPFGSGWSNLVTNNVRWVNIMPDNTIWVVRTDGRLSYGSLNDRLNWKTASIPAGAEIRKVRAVEGTVWAIGPSGVYFTKGASLGNPDGDGWQHVTPPEQPAVLMSGVAINPINGQASVFSSGSQHVYIRTGSSFTSAGTDWQLVDNRYSIDRADSLVSGWVHQQSQQIWVYNDLSWNNPVLISGSAANGVAVSRDGLQVWVFNQNGLYRRQGVTKTNVIGSDWNSIPSPTFESTTTTVTITCVSVA